MTRGFKNETLQQAEKKKKNFFLKKFGESKKSITFAVPLTKNEQAVKAMLIQIISVGSNQIVTQKV